MSVRLPTACLVPAALIAAGWCLSAAAKPPDLPVKEQIVCAPPATPAPEEDDLHARARWETGRRTLRRCLLFAAHPLLAVLPVDEWLEEDGDEAAAGEIPVGPAVWTDGFRFGVDFNTGQGLTGHIVPTPAQEKPESDTSCPYLRRQAARPQEPAAEMPGDPLDNLRKLEEARKLLRQADFFRRTGRPESAQFYYGLVQRHCPDSRYDEVATEQLSRLPAEAAQGTAGEEQEQPPGQPFTCPYLREKSAREQAAAPRGAQAAGTVLDNLERLERAAQVYRRAESYRRRGRLEEARGCYESVRDLCPGSSVARLASDRLEQLRDVEAGSAGEEEDTPPPTPKQNKSEKHSSARSLGNRVSALLERCQRAVAAGRYAEAETLARRAIALDPDAVAASPLVYKLHLLTQLREKAKHPSPWGGYGLWDAEWDAERGKVSSDRLPGELREGAELMRRFMDFYVRGMYVEAELCALHALALSPKNVNALAAARLAAMQCLSHPPISEPAACPWATEPRTTMRQPDLPPVDPKVVGGLEEILTEIGEPDAEKVTVTVEEQGADEDQGEPPASAEGVPTLLIDPPGDDPADHAAKNLTLQDLLDTLRSTACVEFGNTPFCGRGQCQVALGTMSARVAWDCRDERGSFVLSLVFGETPDLRAEQWEYNDRVADWIATHGGGAVPPASERGDTEESEESWRP
jgi:tetratricopeptide (TPR) repeat protein